MPEVNADEPGRATITMIQMGLGAQGPQQRAKYLSDAQMQLGWALRAAVQECQEAGLSWQAIGTALGVPKETLFRQFSAGGPVITAKPVQSMASPGATIMHQSGVEAVYAFRSQNGNWFGPHKALPAGPTSAGMTGRTDSAVTRTNGRPHERGDDGSTCGTSAVKSWPAPRARG